MREVFAACLFAAALFGAAMPALGAEPACRFLLLPGAFEKTSFVGNFVLPEEAYFKAYREPILRRGCELEQMAFPADATIEQRAFLIRNRLDERGPFHVIAHSQSGLDLRYAFQTLGLAPARVRSVTSIGTPHGGSRVASWALGHQRRKSLLYRVLSLLGYDIAALRFLPEMEPEFLREKSRYFSAEPPVPWFYPEVSCRSGCHLFFRVLDRLTGAAAGDGMVESASQAFGKSLGDFDLDHLSEISAEAFKASERNRMIEAMLDAALADAGPGAP